jgi:uracil-DNA glycosylase family 4
MTGPDPGRDCPRCPRLVAFRQQARTAHPAWHNAPVPAFGDPQAWLAIIGLAPGLHGANRTGRPFTGDHAGLLLYDTLLATGLATGRYHPDGRDDLRLSGCIIINTLRCVPPANKPLPAEIAQCRPFFEGALAALPRLTTLIALGTIAHAATLRAHGLPASRHRFDHGATHALPLGRTLIDSFHCSRLNTNTGRLTPAMFEAVFHAALSHRASPRRQENA